MARDHPRIYLTVPEAADLYHLSRSTVRNYLEDIEAETRYRGEWIVLKDTNPRLINRNVFEDYLYFRTYLHDRNLRKNLQPYNAVLVARQRGEWE